MNSQTPNQDAVDHIRFQLDLLRLCTVPQLAKTVAPEALAETVSTQERELAELAQVPAKR